MNAKTTVLLIIALIACVGYVVVRHTPLLGPDGPDQGPAESRRVFTAPSGAKRLIIAPAGEEKTVFEKIADDWYFIEPINARADDNRVLGLVDALLDLEYERRVEPGDEDDDDAVTGLNQPRWTVTLVDQKDATRLLHVGRQVPKIGASGRDVYVRAGDGKSYLVSVDFDEKLGQPLKNFRSKVILNLNT